MKKEELEKLYMDIYDNGIPDYGYKEKFKRYVNNRLDSLEKENEELRTKYLQTTDEGTSWAHIKSLEQENAQLKEANQTLALSVPTSTRTAWAIARIWRCAGSAAGITQANSRSGRNETNLR